MHTAIAATAHEDTIQRSYIAYYARPADPAGMDFWRQRLNDNNGDIQGIIDDFGNSIEYVDRFSSLSNTQLVNNLFRNLFNRDADAAGLNFYVNLLSTGQSSLARIALDIINGSQNDDLVIVNNKLEVAHYYTEAVRAGSLSYDLEGVVTILSTVNANSSSVNLAQAEIDNSGNGSNTTGMASINRGDEFFGTVERFNRYYTDASYSPSRRLYVSPNGNGGGVASDPMSVDSAFAQLTAGTEIRFLPGEYNGCWGVDEDASGTYNDPVVIKADPGVTVNCCNTGRRSCFNLEFADYVAIDGFHLNGGDYGVRSVGGYATSEHQAGVAILNNHGENQNKDPFFTGGSDWVVVENNIANNAGAGDGHGIYLSNGGDWMIVRGNELYNNASSDLQINADPISTCEEEGIAYTDPRCDGSATNGLGQGVSEFILVENNYLHNSAVGPNFTSVRNSVFRNNIIGFYERHNTSFWQETDNPNLGSSNNTVEHNLFIGENSRHVLQFVNSSVNNTVRNNVLLGVTLSGNSATINNNTVLIEQDGTTQGTNTFAGNYLVGANFENFTPSGSNQQSGTFNTNWFANFPTNRMGSINDFQPTANAPFLDAGDLQSSSATDINGTSRNKPSRFRAMAYGCYGYYYTN